MADLHGRQGAFAAGGEDRTEGALEVREEYGRGGVPAEGVDLAGEEALGGPAQCGVGQGRDLAGRGGVAVVAVTFAAPAVVSAVTPVALFGDPVRFVRGPGPAVGVQAGDGGEEFRRPVVQTGGRVVAGVVHGGPVHADVRRADGPLQAAGEDLAEQAGDGVARGAAAQPVGDRGPVVAGGEAGRERPRVEPPGQGFVGPAGFPDQAEQEVVGSGHGGGPSLRCGSLEKVALPCEPSRGKGCGARAAGPARATASTDRGAGGAR